MMHKVLVSIPEELAARLRVVIPTRQRSKIITKLICREVEQREQQLYKCALAVEKDTALNKEIEEWNITTGDGLDDL